MCVGFSKALPVDKSVIPDDPGTLRTQAPVPILLAHLCDYLDMDTPSPPAPWTHCSFPPPLPINCRPRRYFCVANLSRVPVSILILKDFM